ncbi:hypothetical protein K2173_010831 [Erythroxylum novogranatense]|uniref:Reverse transcriptase zinc-binding domain-containing protein n=1 Tax=Erythroxylum novogranatense TaxID=1862640 RepID=A0AAV8T160_9ROSI|nr:hypothetical protein K2173_010831 [Erythroxylum novogranatense]
MEGAVWKKLWKVRVPPKVQNVIWRALSGVPPCRSVLVQRRVPVIDSCPFCCGFNETVMHVLVECPFVVNIWRLVGFTTTLFPINSFMGWCGQRCNAWSAIHMARNYFDEWSAANIQPVPATSSRALHQWKSPPNGFLKINVDASTGTSTGYVGIGAVVRRADGGFLVARAWRVVGFFSAKTAEAIAIRKVLSWIKARI